MVNKGEVRLGDCTTTYYDRARSEEEFIAVDPQVSREQNVHYATYPGARPILDLPGWVGLIRATHFCKSLEMEHIAFNLRPPLFIDGVSRDTYME